MNRAFFPLPLRVVSYNAAKPEGAFEDINTTQIFLKDRCFLLQSYGKLYLSITTYSGHLPSSDNLRRSISRSL